MKEKLKAISTLYAIGMGLNEPTYAQPVDSLHTRCLREECKAPVILISNNKGYSKRKKNNRKLKKSK